MVFKRKSIVLIGITVLCAAIASLAGGLLTSGDSSRWTSHIDIGWYSELAPSYTIDSPEDLAGVAKLVNDGYIETEDGVIPINGFAGKRFDIEGDLDLSPYLWVPIGTPENPFRGTMYSKNGIHTISGMKLAPETVYAGLVGYMDGGTLGGLIFAGDGVFSLHNSWQDLYAGVAVGKMTGLSTVYDITNYMPIQAGSVNAGVYAGGIVGSGEGTIFNSVNHADLTINAQSVYAGGIVGYTDDDQIIVKNVTNNGAVTSNGFDQTGGVYAGGIAGYAAGPLFMQDQDTPIANIGAVTASNGSQTYAGGIVGKAGAEVKFSNVTSNAGAVLVNAPGASGSYAGGLVGAIAAEQADSMFRVTFASTGAVTNNGGNGVYTGGIAGYIGSRLQWSNATNNQVAVTASGASAVYTGGLVGYASGDQLFQAEAQNAGTVTVSGAANEAYTGGLFGYAGSRLQLDSALENAYGNSGAISVAGGTGVYTGGMTGNRAYTNAAGEPAVNVTSTAAITVSGASKLYTGGFIGMLADGVDRKVAGAVFGNTIQVTAAGSNPEQHVRTGGIVGYMNGAEVADSAFTGTLKATGGDFVYTGGIAGAADAGTITNASAGHTQDAYALIESDGAIGGIAGAWNGAMQGATSEYVTLTMTRSGGAAGGLAGKAKGRISNAMVGDSAYEGSDSVRIGAAAGIQPITAGGMIGMNDGALSLVSGTATKVALLNEAGTSGNTIGGIAGALTADAKIGTIDAPVVAQNITLLAESDNSDIGGAAGVTHAAELFVTAEGIELTVEGHSVRAGVIAGRNEGVISETASGLIARDSSVIATGASASIGGLFGENNGAVPAALTQGVTIEASGEASLIGGAAGRNTGTLTNSRVNELALIVKGPGSSAGGVAGLSEPGESMSAPVILTPAVQAEEAVLLSVEAADVRAGGIVGSAKGTRITRPAVAAEDGFTVLIGVKAERAAAGGLAGRAERSVIEGDTVGMNVQNLLLTTTAAASDAAVGGLVGYNEESLLDQAVGRQVNLLLSGSHALAGGMAGYNRGTDTAVISNVYISGLYIRANAGAEASTIGGFVGLNDKRLDEAADDPAEGISTIQKSRYVGVAGPGSSQTILVQSPRTIVGGMVGENRSLIANSSISDKLPLTITGNDGTIGGLAGINTADGLLYYTYSNAQLNIQGTGTLAGGLVGGNNGKVMSSYTETDLTGKAAGTSGQYAPLGGLIGRNAGKVETSYTSAAVVSEGDYSVAGGLIGEQIAGSVDNSYVVKDVAAAGEHAYAGGFIGRLAGGSVRNVYSAAEVTAADGAFAGGFAGRYDNASKELLSKAFYVMDEAEGANVDLPDFADGNHKWLNVALRLSTVTYAQLKDRAAFPGLSGWNFDTVWKYGSPYGEFQYPELIRSANTGGGGSDVNANINWYMKDQDAVIYDIRSESELAGLAAIVNGDVPGLAPFDFAGREIRILNPIHIQSLQWTPIGVDADHPFEGMLDGGNHLIDGLTIVPDHDYSGLLGVIGENAEVRSMLLEPLTVAGKGHTGVLAGVNKGSLDHITIHLRKSAVVSGGIAGSFLGGNESTGTFANVTVTMENGSRVEGAYEGSVAGGLIGHNASVLTPDMFAFEAESGSVVSGADHAAVGGLIGWQSADASGLHADIVSNYRIIADGDGSMIGGLIGKYDAGIADGLTVTFKDGKLEAPGAGSMLGGVIGYSDAGNTIRNTSVTADKAGHYLTGSGAVGGIAGSKKGSGTNAFDIEQASADMKLIIASFDTSSGAKLGGIAGVLTDAAMRSASSAATIDARGSDTAAGGIVGHAFNSIMYKVTSTPKLSLTASGGEGAIGGIAGVIESDDRDRPYDFGLWAPLYHGIYDATAQGSPIAATGLNDNSADLFAGGLVGKNVNASIYQSNAGASLSVSGGKLAAAGGIAGYNDGIMVRLIARGKVEAAASSIYRIGGIIGWSEGGGIHYTKLLAPAGSALKVGDAVSRPGIVPAVEAGGFIGKGDYTAITHSSTDIAVEIISANADSTIYAGGFAGLLGDSADSASVLENAFAIGKVTVNGQGSSSAGGFAGSVDQYRITGAYASGSVYNKGTVIRSGGFAGSVESKAAIDKVYAVQAKVESVGPANAARAYTGGLAGYNDGSIRESYAGAATITASATGTNVNTGALVGYQFRVGKLADNRYASSLGAVGRESGVSSGNQKEALTDPLAARDWDYEYDTYFLSEPNNGVVSIQTVKQLTGAILLYNDSTGLDYYKLYNRAAERNLAMPKLALEADLDVTGLRIAPFDHFGDVFDGQGHVIKGFAWTAEDLLAPAGFFLTNEGEILNVSLLDFTVKGGAAAGIATGLNGPAGIIRGVDVRGSVEGIGGAAGSLGGIAGANEGVIAESYARGSVKETSAEKVIAAGGITGVNAGGGTVAESFAFADVIVSGGDVKAGGIAGINAGTIRDTFNSGYVRADGSAAALAGGIAGYAVEGAIDSSVNAGEAVAGSAGQIPAGQAYFGGIAGQLETAASVTDSVFNKQMLKRNTAYYNADGVRVPGGASANAEGMTAADLTNGTLPAQLSSDKWHTAPGFYPRLDVFEGEPGAALGAAAIRFSPTDIVNRVENSFGLTRSSNVAWSAGSSGVSIAVSGNQTIGSVRVGVSAMLNVAVSGESRSIAINAPAWTFAETSLAPTVVSGDKTFTDTVTVVLGTEEPDGRIYYTTDGSRPTEDSPLYTAPIALDRTTTIKAVTIVDDKEESVLLTGVWTKGTGGFGGGGGGAFFPPAPEEPAPSIVAEAGNQSADGTSEQPVKVARNSKLSLTAPEGQIIYYTTDGSTPTTSSPQFKGELLITGNMTIKAITDKDDRVVTIKYEVERPWYDVKEDAGEIKYMTGYNDGTFRPDNAITRMELIDALAPLLDKEDVELGTLFTDVRASDGAEVAFFESAGIIEGYPDGTFGGGKGLTRAEFTVIMSRVLNLDIKKTGKTALNDISGHWAEKYVNAFTAAGYVNGFPDGSFRPEEEISRAQAVVMINRIIGSAGQGGTGAFSDLPESHWAYKEIMASVK